MTSEDFPRYFIHVVEGPKKQFWATTHKGLRLFEFRDDHWEELQSWADWNDVMYYAKEGHLIESTVPPYGLTQFHVAMLLGPGPLTGY